MLTIGKTVRTVVQDQPRIARISLAVMVDGTMIRGVDGRSAWSPRSQGELDQIATLAKSAIGFDSKRGDTVSVVSMPFATPSSDSTQTAPSGLLGGLHLTRDDVMRLGQNGLLGTLVLLALVFVVRPMALRLTTLPATSTDSRNMGDPAVSELEDDLSLDGVRRAALSGPLPSGSGVALLGPPGHARSVQADESMISIANIDGRLRASSIRQIVDLVGKHPEESLSILRGWLGHEQGAG